MTEQAEIRAPSVLPAFLSLFASTGTLICCALPAMLVTFGMGAVMAGLIEAVPGITFFGKHKVMVFAAAGSLLALSGAWQWYARSLPCPADPVKARACTRARVVGGWVWAISVALYLIGGFFAFFAADIFF